MVEENVKRHKISDLQPNSKVFNLVAAITHLEDIIEAPDGRKLREGVIQDQTGQVKLTLWSTQVDQFNVGDTIIVKQGWCKAYNDEMQVSSGIKGKIELIPPPKQN